MGGDPGDAGILSIFCCDVRGAVFGREKVLARKEARILGIIHRVQRLTQIFSGGVVDGVEPIPPGLASCCMRSPTSARVCFSCRSELSMRLF